MHLKSWKVILSSVVLFALVTVGPLYAQVNLIDPFDTAQAELLANSGNVNDDSWVSGGDIFGGERDLLVGYTAGPNDVTVSVNAGALSHSQESLTTGYSVVTWDGPDNDSGNLDPTGLGGVDLTNGGLNDRFWIYVVSCDWGSTLTLDVYTDGGNWSRGSVAIPPFTLNTALAVPFATFTAQDGTGADFTKVGAIVLDIDGRTTADLDLTLDWIGPRGPLAADLAAFSATAAGDAIQVEWTTATEVDNLGFNVYRAESPDGPRTRLNAGLIPSQAPGSAVGATYEFVDESATPGATYYYWLEDVDTYGSATLHGPVSAQLALARRLLPARTRPLPALPFLQAR